MNANSPADWQLIRRTIARLAATEPRLSEIRGAAWFGSWESIESFIDENSLHDADPETIALEYVEADDQ
jgi:hypothetical protein